MYNRNNLPLNNGDYPLCFRANSEEHDKFTITFPYQTAQVTAQVTPQVTPQVTQQVTPQVIQQVGVSDKLATILQFCEEPHSLKEMMMFVGLKHRKIF